MAGSTYVIRGGAKGRERLRILSRVMAPASHSALDRIGISPGAVCLDVGCGGGDMTLELARRAGPNGRVVGIDFDEAKLELARSEAREQGVENVEFRPANANEPLGEGEFDLVYCRFILSHLPDPAGCLRRIHSALKPGGSLVAEDVDFAGHFSYPESDVFQRCAELYIQAVQSRGGDPLIGRRLPSLLMDAGFEQVGMNVVQLAGLQGEVKLIPPLTTESIAHSVLADQLATPDELESLISRLYEFVENPRTVVSLPRMVQAWGNCAS